MIQPNASKIWMFFNFYLDPLQSHNKVTASRFSVEYIDGCPLGTGYFVHRYVRPIDILKTEF